MNQLFIYETMQEEKLAERKQLVNKLNKNKGCKEKKKSAL